MLGLGLGDRRRHALGGQAVPDRRQLRQRRAVAIELARGSPCSPGRGRWRRESGRRDCRSSGSPRRSRPRSRSGRCRRSCGVRGRRRTDRQQRPSAAAATEPIALDGCASHDAALPASMRWRLLGRALAASRERDAPGCACTSADRYARAAGDRGNVVASHAAPIAALADRRSPLAGRPRRAAPSRAAAEVRAPRARVASALGAKLFVDPRLSPPARSPARPATSPAHAFGPPNGAARCSSPAATCASPACARCRRSRYLQAVPPFTEHFFESEDEADESVDNGADRRPDLGRPRRPRRTTRRASRCSPPSRWRTRAPARSSPRRSPPATAPTSTRSAAPALADDPSAPSPRSSRRSRSSSRTGATFYPYTSKYDAYLAGKATLTPAEARGLELFEAEDKGNCASCHFSAAAASTARRRSSPTTA